ncbi:sigma-54 dependent transcriptional regulator [Sphingobium sp. H39-3-25]|uniref:sigma-54 interaction domain-containing protein n=1 Tax=Sphingobium arseniciresistens TaxID=3030834 RepID=UPI0023B9202D|nr:sigma-54 dependent transcriptional regulator [Sphingobium arseniciresistens]
MSGLDMSLGVCGLIPGLRLWLDNAYIACGSVAADAPRDRGAIRIMLDSEIAHATHRDILIDYRPGAPLFQPAANGMPARIAFGIDDASLGMAMIAELARGAGMPAVGDAGSAKLMTLAARIARSDATVLIQGDTGTGKEGMARFLHANSNRNDRDFIAVNCAALPETMMEAMLFGHRKGAFTGAAAASDGLFLAADGGTLFLDEIAELPLALQAKLLRALQEGEILPVGATHPVPVNVRVIAACNRDLVAECDAGRFRSDLYWRLNVMPLELRPLADRRQDIPAITAALLLRQFRHAGAQEIFPWPTAEAMDCLIDHSWPGNARELGNMLQRAVVLREGDRITPADLAIAPAASAPVAPPAQVPAMTVPSRVTLPTRLKDVARMSKIDAIRHALRETDGHRALAARKLGISERTLRYRLAEMRDLAAA